MGSSRAPDYAQFDDVAVRLSMGGFPVDRRLTIAEAAEVVRRMTVAGQPARTIGERLYQHPRSVRRIRARLRAMGRL